jgi:hypothetical protein
VNTTERAFAGIASLPTPVTHRAPQSGPAGESSSSMHHDTPLSATHCVPQSNLADEASSIMHPGTPQSNTQRGQQFNALNTNARWLEMNIGSEEFVNQNVMFNLIELSPNALIRLKKLLALEFKSKTNPNYNMTTNIATCVMCPWKSCDVGSVRKHESSAHFKCLIQYRVVYGRNFEETLNTLIREKC